MAKLTVNRHILKPFGLDTKPVTEKCLAKVGDNMGFEDLRKVKISYRPFKLVPKYTIYQK
ncbi:MAG: hypothetical protein MUP09_03520 [Thiovulaceae bacterium]|nr:hypothetical protein [Sulfurimonadaceae bacterium]